MIGTSEVFTTRVRHGTEQGEIFGVSEEFEIATKHESGQGGAKVDRLEFTGCYKQVELLSEGIQNHGQKSNIGSEVLFDFRLEEAGSRDIDYLVKIQLSLLYG